MATRKRLLFLSQLFPLPVASGTQLRTFNLLVRLGRRFDVTFFTVAADPGWKPHLDELRRHAVDVVTVVPDNKRSPLHRAAYKALYWIRRILFAETSDRFYNTMPAVNRSIRALHAATRFDIVVSEYWYWDRCLFDAAPGLKVIDANDVQAMRVEALLERTTNPVDRLLAPRLLRRYREFERQALARADVVVATTNRDAAVFRSMLPATVETLTIPTGLDTDYFVPQPNIEPEPRNVVFYGALANPMNRDAVQFLVQEILPALRARVPDVHLTLVGSSPQPEQLEMARRDPDITLTGWIEDVRAPLARAAVVVCPLRFGYGIRGRIFELLSMQVPVVATSVAVAGMDLVSGDGLLLADGAEAFAAAVAGLLEDPGRRVELAQRARQLAVERMSIGATYDRLAEFLDQRTAREAVSAGRR